MSFHPPCRHRRRTDLDRAEGNNVWTLNGTPGQFPLERERRLHG